MEGRSNKTWSGGYYWGSEIQIFEREIDVSIKSYSYHGNCFRKTIGFCKKQYCFFLRMGKGNLRKKNWFVLLGLECATTILKYCSRRTRCNETGLFIDLPRNYDCSVGKVKNIVLYQRKKIREHFMVSVWNRKKNLDSNWWAS